MILDAAQTEPPETFHRNRWTVTALQAAWSSIVHTPVPAGDPSIESFSALHVQHSLETAIGIGHDTDTVAAIAGGLLGARWGHRPFRHGGVGSCMGGQACDPATSYASPASLHAGVDLTVQAGRRLRPFPTPSARSFRYPTHTASA